MRRVIAFIASLALATAFAFPASALAAQTDVSVENHAGAGKTTVSGISIGDVDAPSAGKPLDDRATVTTSEGATWDIPVIWISDEYQVATEAVEGRSYLPVLAFFVPGDYSLEGATFTVTLSQQLAALFGTDEAVSVYVPETGITYILPASLRHFFAPQARTAQRASAAEASMEPAALQPEAAAEAPLTPVEVFCAKTARDNFTDEDLSWFIDYVLHTLQPQATNLLIEKFPAFSEAARNGGLGDKIGMYIYFEKGDPDGNRAHESTLGSLAYLSGEPVLVDGSYTFGYMIAVDLEDVTVKDDADADKCAVDPSTGKYRLLRDGDKLTTLENTIVHEMLHAFMDDYNRTGMQGATNMADVVTDSGGEWKWDGQYDRYKVLHFPSWFVEGTASAVENVFRFRGDNIELIYPKDPGTMTREKSLVVNYLNNDRLNTEGKKIRIDIALCDEENRANKLDLNVSRYASGYLATLYLCELAARSTEGVGSSKVYTDGGASYYFSADKLRMGMNTILARTHEGETLDSVIASISPKVEGENGTLQPLYANTDDFEAKFVKGVGTDDPDDPDGKIYDGDMESIAFVTDYVDYLRSFDTGEADGFVANGSILFPLDMNFDTPLDSNWKGTSDYYQIVPDNGYVVSSVPDSEALKSGGKSTPPDSTGSVSAQQESPQLVPAA